MKDYQVLGRTSEFDIGQEIYIMIFGDSHSATIKKAKITAIDLYRDMTIEFLDDNIFYEIEIDSGYACLRYRDKSTTDEKQDKDITHIFRLIGYNSGKTPEHLLEEIEFKYNKKNDKMQLFEIPEYCLFSSTTRAIEFFRDIDELSVNYRENNED